MSSSAATRVFCFDELGNVVVVERSELRKAPAVYGVLVEEGRALLMAPTTAGVSSGGACSRR